jgi:hypothetical protein
MHFMANGQRNITKLPAIHTNIVGQYPKLRSHYPLPTTHYPQSPPLHHPADKTLQVLGLGAGHGHGMIGGGAALFEHLYVAASLLGHTGEHGLEVLAKHMPRATTCDQHATWFQ